MDESQQEDRIFLEKSCWKALCLLRETVREYPGKIHSCSLLFGKTEEVRINSSLSSQKDHFLLTLLLNNDLRYQTEHSSLPFFLKRMLCLYLPYCFFAVQAKKEQRSLVVSHFAQSLDGYIATECGDSKWIGNSENLVHAHRMRALCDAVLVGRGTLREDSPKLTVRHVEGKNPIRILLGAREEDLPFLKEFDSAPVYLVGKKASHQENVTFLPLKDLLSLLKELYKRGIYSIYIEGGAYTSSRFLQEKLIDTIQIHIAPLILGNGRGAFTLPKIEQISQGVQFSSHSYEKIGNAIMFTGQVEKEIQERETQERETKE